ncbi:MAG: siderophore-interacting protein [Thalassobaculaceae bacterium]|nr:siderophore-interacting protein [Thalassobaculaceae bacterium]
MTRTLHAELALTVDQARIWLDGQVAHLAEHDLQPVVRTPDTAEFCTDYGTFRVQVAGQDLRIQVESGDVGGLEVLQESISHYLTSHDGALADRLAWSGHRPAGRPTNFREMRVSGRSLVSPRMIRLTLTGEDIDHFAARGLHVRLLLPPANSKRPVVWPRRSGSGAVQLPEGADALTVRVYTIRHIRPDRGEIDVDIVRHAGGVFADWAETAETGALVGVMGPGGGFYPEGDWLLIGGDETALPAISRILEHLPADAEGHAMIGLRHGDGRMEIAAPAGVTVDWVTGDDTALVRAMEAVRPPLATDVAVWFAGEAEAARRLRQFFKERLGLSPDRVTSAVYWRRGGPG